jgi:spore germination protein GerM
MKVRFSIIFILIFVFIFSGCRVRQQLEESQLQSPQTNQQTSEQKMETTQTQEQYSTEISDKTKVNILLYFGDSNVNYLVPEERYVKLNKSLERTIVEELIKGPTNLENVAVIPGGTKLLSVIRKEDAVIVDLSQEFREKIGAGSAGEVLATYSIVNSLTEIPGIKKVLFRIQGKTYDTLGGHLAFNEPFKRNRSLFNRNKSLGPGEVLRQQMLYEQQGKWLNSYILSSDDENNTHRRYYNDYVKEMEEIKALGFLNQDFEVGKVTLDKTGNHAKVNLQFYTKDQSGKKVPGANMTIDCIKIDGAWLVDWTPPQQ